MTITTIAIWDNQYLTRQGCRQLVMDDQHFDLLWDAPVGEGKLPGAAPDILITDPASWPRGIANPINGLNGTHVLIISDESRREVVNQWLGWRIQGFLTKHCSGEEIHNALLALSRGEKFYCNKVLEVVLEKAGYNNGAEDCSPTVLTQREIEIVNLLAAGKHTKDIAAELHLSTHTVYTHRKNILRKLGVRNVQELVIYALRKGISVMDT